MSTTKPNSRIPLPATTAAGARRSVVECFQRHFAGHDTSFVQKLFDDVEELFAGKHPGYLACDLPFHDFTHTCDVTLCLVRIMDGHARNAGHPNLSARDFELAVAAALFHDSGYLKETADRDGTGAKYTFTHVERGVAVAARFLGARGVPTSEIETVQAAIQCTGTMLGRPEGHCLTARDRFMADVLCTADLLGQMASEQYPERLPALFREFAEAIRFAGSQDHPMTRYRSARDLMAESQSFWERVVRPMLDERWGGVCRHLSSSLCDGDNLYLAAIEENLARIRVALSGVN